MSPDPAQLVLLASLWGAEVIPPLAVLLLEAASSNPRHTLGVKTGCEILHKPVDLVQVLAG